MVLCLTGGTRVAFLCFFASHIPITLFIDGQAALPHYIYPRIVQDLLDWYTGTFKDHLMSRPHDLWFTSIVTCELIFQVPFFFYAVYALSNPARVSLALMSVCSMARQLCRFISFLIFCIGVRKGYFSQCMHCIWSSYIDNLSSNFDIHCKRRTSYDAGDVDTSWILLALLDLPFLVTCYCIYIR